MFFALVANDRATFDRLLGWTRTNLAGNQFDVQKLSLPAWQWGKKPDGSYGVLDPNSASDSDLWIAYDLLQAGRLWHDTGYTKLGEALATQIASKEVVSLAGLGPMLLPGPQGFQSGGVTRLNPSYLPLPVLRALARAQPGGPWSKLADNALQLVKTTAPQGFAPDWAAWRAGQFVVDPKSGDTGEGPLSYWGALAPYFKALGDERGLGLARTHLAALDSPVAGREPVYYDRVLGLFGTGFIDGRYRFDDAGRLVPSWRNACD